MFDPSKLSPTQRQQLIQSLKQTRNNPFAMLKLKTMQSALILKHWIEENAPQHQNNFQTMWSGFENQINRLFTDAENEIQQKLEFPEIKAGNESFNE